MKTGRKGEGEKKWRRVDEEGGGSMRAFEKGGTKGPTNAGGGETGAMRLERGGLDVGRPERARTTALGRDSFSSLPPWTSHLPATVIRGDDQPPSPLPAVATAPIHKFPYITPLLQSRNERQPIQGSVTRLWSLDTDRLAPHSFYDFLLRATSILFSYYALLNI